MGRVLVFGKAGGYSVAQGDICEGAEAAMLDVSRVAS